MKRTITAFLIVILVVAVGFISCRGLRSQSAGDQTKVAVYLDKAVGDIASLPTGFAKAKIVGNVDYKELVDYTYTGSADKNTVLMVDAAFFKASDKNPIFDKKTDGFEYTSVGPNVKFYEKGTGPSAEVVAAAAEEAKPAVTDVPGSAILIGQVLKDAGTVHYFTSGRGSSDLPRAKFLRAVGSETHIAAEGAGEAFPAFDVAYKVSTELKGFSGNTVSLTQGKDVALKWTPAEDSLPNVVTLTFEIANDKGFITHRLIVIGSHKAGGVTIPGDKIKEGLALGKDVPAAVGVATATIPFTQALTVGNGAINMKAERGAIFSFTVSAPPKEEKK